MSRMEHVAVALCAIVAAALLVLAGHRQVVKNRQQPAPPPPPPPAVTNAPVVSLTQVSNIFYNGMRTGYIIGGLHGNEADLNRFAQEISTGNWNGLMTWANSRIQQK